MSTVDAMASNIYMQYAYANSGSAAGGSTSNSSASGPASGDSLQNGLLSQLSESSSVESSLITQLTGTAASGVSLSDLLSEAENAQAQNASNASFAGSQASALQTFNNDVSAVFSAAQKVTGSTGLGLSYDSDGGDVSESSVDALVSAYNSLVQNTAGNSAYVRSDAISSLKMDVDGSASSLSEIGVTENGDGTLSVDSDTLESALQNAPGSVEQALTGANGLASNLQLSAQGLMSQPLSTFAAAQSPSGGSSALYTEAAMLSASSLWSALSGSLLNTAA